MTSLLDVARERYGELELGAVTEALRRAGAHCSPGARIPGLEAAESLLDMRLDAASVATALLAQVLPSADEDTSSGDATRPLLEGVARLNRIRWDRLDDEAAESLRKMFLAMARDVRVVLIVLALRVEQLRHSSELSEAEQSRLAREAREVFAPLANRLGVWQFKSALEDAAFLVLEPENHRRLAELLERGSEGRRSFVDEVVHDVTVALERAGISAKVDGRAKHLYSIYKKMLRKQVDFEQVFDISAVRVITDGVAECYAALGVVHSMWRPIKGEFDDYIAMPKGNGYQSLHTAVVGPRGRPAEIQIRTKQMHRFAEFGVAAHWAYKESRKSSDSDRFMVLRRLLDWERELEDPKNFVESLKTDIFEDQVLVFTPKGDVIDLPRGATALDFAYRVHTMVGHRTRGARVNGQIVALDVPLKTGDRVEILTHKQACPSRDWMNPKLGFLKTAGARGKVRHWFREQGRERALSEGQKLLERELSRLGLDKVTPLAIVKALDLDGVEALHAALGYGDRSISAVAALALDLERGKRAQPKLEVRSKALPSGGTSALSLHGVGDVLGSRAHCCNPLPGDDVLGFVTRGRGITIHRRACSNVRQSPEPERWVEIDWGRQGKEAHRVELEIVAQQSSGLLNRVVRLLNELGVAVTAANLAPDANECARLRVAVEARDSEQLTHAVQSLSAQAEVERVGIVQS